MKRLIKLVLVVVLFVSLASAQTGLVTRNVNLRPDASTGNNPIEKLKPGHRSACLNPIRQADFSTSRLPAATPVLFGQRTFKFRVIPVAGAASGSSVPSSSGGDLLTRLMAARQEAVGQPLVEKGTVVCGATGNAPDQKTKDLNNNKNRTDQPGDSTTLRSTGMILRRFPRSRERLAGRPRRGCRVSLPQDQRRKQWERRVNQLQLDRQ